MKFAHLAIIFVVGLFVAVLIASTRENSPSVDTRELRMLRNLPDASAHLRAVNGSLVIVKDPDGRNVVLVSWPTKVTADTDFIVSSPDGLNAYDGIFKPGETVRAIVPGMQNTLTGAARLSLVRDKKPYATVLIVQLPGAQE